jgi:hypothetical protein
MGWVWAFATELAVGHLPGPAHSGHPSQQSRSLSVGKRPVGCAAAVSDSIITLNMPFATDSVYY